MTPQTRALIEAAEKHISHCRCGGTGLYAYNPYLVDPVDCSKCSDLRAAISSAKAAEEGNTPDEEHVPVCDERGPKTKERCKRDSGHSGRHTGRSEGWYTTVIEVREKEGL